MTHFLDVEEYMAHYGMPRRSGRYPWGSGENPYQRNASFLGTVAELKKEGMTEPEIARAAGVTTTQLRAMKSIARNANRQADISQAERLRERGWSYTAIGERMGKPESSIRAMLAPGVKDRADILTNTANVLKKHVDEKGIIDVGVGVEHHLGVSNTRLRTAVAVLQEQGYEVHSVKIPQLGTGHMTEYRVLVPPGVTQKEAWMNRHNIKQVTEYSEDGGRTFLGIEPPTSIDSKRVAVNYSEKNSKGEEVGGGLADGVIYVRPGVEDVSLGKSNYAQVRIAVDDTHYLKGMAVYKDDLPAGKDLVFNTNKRRSEVANDHEAMKPLTKDPDNPFGATITRQTGVMNIVNEEGDWEGWTRSLSSQMLSKQSPKLVKEQLDMSYERRKNELESISELTNPAVKRKLLETFADGADSASVHLKAAAMPRQTTSVILPVNSLKSSEVYAPNYKNGDRVVLIRHPHGGIFEIPELTVNNRNREGQQTIGKQATDAIGINSKVAERLSGADFDGDHVLVLPNNQGRVKTAPALEDLKDFDPRSSYPAYEGMKPMSPRTKQVQMGEVSNLITDMTIRGASASELARAVKHSMVVIDAEKHNLNYKQSALDNNIRDLKKKYQAKPGGKYGGASTLISRASSEVWVPERKPRPMAEGGPIDKDTGRLVFVPTGATRTNRKGEIVPKREQVAKAALTDDAHTLSSGEVREKIYADHSNRLKSLANQARKEMINTKSLPYSPSAKAAYSNEVASLDSKLNLALRNAPLERQAQVVANAVVASKRRADPSMEPDEVKRLKNQALAEARTRTGAGKQRIEITEREWEAVQAGAISNSKLEKILNNANLDQIKELATPRQQLTMTPSKIARARSMAALGYTQAEIASQLGVSVSTITTALK